MRLIIDDMTLVNDAPTDDDTMRAAKDLCVRSMHLMADGTLDQFEEIVHPEACNRRCRWGVDPAVAAVFGQNGARHPPASQARSRAAHSRRVTASSRPPRRAAGAACDAGRGAPSHTPGPPTDAGG